MSTGDSYIRYQFLKIYLSKTAPTQVRNLYYVSSFNHLLEEQNLYTYNITS